MVKQFRSRKTEFGNFAKTQKIWYAQVNSKDQGYSIVIFDAGSSFLETVFFAHETVLYHRNCHKETLLLDRENSGNLKMNFDWSSSTGLNSMP